MAAKAPRRPKTYPLPRGVIYLSRIGAVSFLLAVATTMLTPEYFGYFVVIVYVAIGILAVDSFYEFRGIAARMITAVVTVAVILVFTFGYVRVEAPLVVEARRNDVQYKPGTVIGGVAWDPKFSDLRVRIVNPTDSNYYDLNLIIRPDDPVAHVGQITNLPGVSFPETASAWMYEVDVKMSKGNALQVVPLASSFGIRVQCEKLPRHTEIELVMAVVSIDTSIRGLLTAQLFNGTRVWHLNKDEFVGEITDAYGPRPTPSMVFLESQYTVLQRRREIKEDRKVENVIGRALSRP